MLTSQGNALGWSVSVNPEDDSVSLIPPHCTSLDLAFDSDLLDPILAPPVEFAEETLPEAWEEVRKDITMEDRHFRDTYDTTQAERTSEPLAEENGEEEGAGIVDAHFVNTYETGDLPASDRLEATSAPVNPAEMDAHFANTYETGDLPASSENQLASSEVVDEAVQADGHFATSYQTGDLPALDESQSRTGSGRNDPAYPEAALADAHFANTYDETEQVSEKDRALADESEVYEFEPSGI